MRAGLLLNHLHAHPTTPNFLICKHRRCFCPSVFESGAFLILRAVTYIIDVNNWLRYPVPWSRSSKSDQRARRAGGVECGPVVGAKCGRVDSFRSENASQPSGEIKCCPPGPTDSWVNVSPCVVRALRHEVRDSSALTPEAGLGSTADTSFSAFKHPRRNRNYVFEL